GSEVISVVGDYDWYPSGTSIAFTPYAASNEPLASGLYTLDANQNVRQLYLGGLSTTGNRFGFSWGVNDKVCFAVAGSLRTVNPDGTGMTAILSVSTSNTNLACAQWSP